MMPKPSPAEVKAAGLRLISREFMEKYEVGDLLGKGSYGTVFAGRSLVTGAAHALKVMSRQQLGAKGEATVRREVGVMARLKHEKLLRLHEVFHDDAAIILVLDLVQGGELFQHLLKLQHYSEATAREVVRNLLLAVAYMHSQGVAHRDLKPDNMLLVDVPQKAEEVTAIKVADFGFAASFRDDRLTAPCGTPYYLAPEIIEVGVHKTRDHYSEKCDIWAVGVITYLLLAGYPPFNGSDKPKLFRAICRGRVDFTHAPWGSISYDAKDFILKLLQLSPGTRLDATTALGHKWMQDAPDDHLEPTINALREFAAREKLKGAVFGVEAALRLRYLAKCTDTSCRPNSAVLAAFEGATEPVRRLDMTNNYLGPKGVAALAETLKEHSEVEEVVLTNSLITDEQCSALLSAIHDDRCSVRSLVLDDNPITHTAGRRVLAALQARRKLLHASIGGTACSTSIQRKVREQAERNKALGPASRPVSPAL